MKAIIPPATVVELLSLIKLIINSTLSRFTVHSVELKCYVRSQYPLSTVVV